jgi:hypothetical protein
MAHAVEKSTLAPAVNGAGTEQAQQQPAASGIAGNGLSTITKATPKDLIAASLALFGDRDAERELTPEQRQVMLLLEDRIAFNQARFAPVLQALEQQEAAARAANAKSDAAKPDDAKKA